MKKIIVMLCIIALTVTALAACTAEKTCEHTFSEAWTSDATNHWHQATCEHGESKDSLDVHVDADEDGKCDVCDYEVGHIHTFEDDWTVTDENHYKKATCSHTDVKGEEGLHADDDTNGKCDVCDAHVHSLNAAGYCDGCGKKVNDIDETDIATVIAALVARMSRVNGSIIDYKYSTPDGNNGGYGENAYKSEILFGTNGMYEKRTEATQTLEKWIRLLADDVDGIVAVSEGGKYIDAYPASFGPDDLIGFYYAVSTLANGHGAEAVIASLFELSGYASTASLSGSYTNPDGLVSVIVDEEAKTVKIQLSAEEEEESVNIEATFTVSNGVITLYGADGAEISADTASVIMTGNAITGVTVAGTEYAVAKPGSSVTNLVVNIDPDTNSGSFAFSILVKNTNVAAGEAPNVNYYEVSVEFTYSDDYVLETAEIVCDCYTNSLGDESLNDYTWTEAGGLVMKPTATADTYTFNVTQTNGDRTEIELNDGSQFVPTEFEIYTDEDCTRIATSYELSVGEMDKVLYIKTGPEGTFPAFFDCDITVTDAAGNLKQGVMVVRVGDVIQMYPTLGGEYVATITSELCAPKTINITVTAPEIGGEHFMTIDVQDPHSWSAFWSEDDEGVCFEFEATTPGEYKIYLPYGLSVWEKKAYDKNDESGIYYDFGSLSYGGDGERSFTIVVRPGSTYKFYVKGMNRGTYVIGYDVL